MKKTVVIASVAIFLVLVMAWIIFTDKPAEGNIKYEGEVYEPIDFNADIFYYCYNGDEYFEEDIKYPITGADWKMVYDSGDLFCIRDWADEANEYYADDENYDWFVTITDENDEQEKTYPLDISAEELSYLYGVEDMEKEKSLFFDEIEAFGTLQKVSKDGMVQGITELAYSEGRWYWRSEIIDESREKDGTWPEYVQELPETLRGKLMCYEGTY